MGHDYTASVLFGTLLKFSDIPNDFMKKIEEEFMAAKNPSLGWMTVPNQGKILYLASTLSSMDRHDHKRLRQLNVPVDVENQYVAELNKYPPLFVRLQQVAEIPYWYFIYE